MSTTTYADTDYAITETAFGRVYMQEVVWMRAHGDIPAGFGVSFIDGNPLNCTRDNLELIDGGHVLSHPSALFALAHGLGTQRRDWN